MLKQSVEYFWIHWASGRFGSTKSKEQALLLKKRGCDVTVTTTIKEKL